MTIFERTCAGM